MKKSDIFMIILIASLSVGTAYVVGKTLFTGLITSEPTKVKTVDPITDEIEEPSTAIFNDDAINPAVEVTVDGTSDKKADDTTKTETP